MKPALPEAVPVRRQVPMCDKETISIVETQQPSVGMIADLLLTADRELASFYGAIERRYGPEEARKAASDWIDEVMTMDWPVDGILPNWRLVSTMAADCLASRIIEHSLDL
jgi:hypothetical protein